MVSSVNSEGSGSVMGELPILYSFRRCPYAMRARLALASSGQKCELREIVLADKAAEFLEASPKGTVPVVVLPTGAVIEESLDIMRWALSLRDPERLLDPPEATVDEMLDLIDRSDRTFKRDLDAYKYASRDIPEAGLAARGRGAAFLSALDCRLEERRYLFGDRPSLADMAILPFVRQFANVDRGWFQGEAWPELLQWLDAWLTSERFEGIMKKYPKWKAGDAPLIFG